MSESLLQETSGEEISLTVMETICWSNTGHPNTGVVMLPVSWVNENIQSQIPSASSRNYSTSWKVFKN